MGVAFYQQATTSVVEMSNGQTALAGTSPAFQKRICYRFSTSPKPLLNRSYRAPITSCGQGISRTESLLNQELISSLSLVSDLVGIHSTDQGLGGTARSRIYVKRLRPTTPVLGFALAAALSQLFAAQPQLPSEIVITSRSTTHVHAVISDLPLQKFPALSRIHALFTVYFDGGATDEKLKALAQLPFTNLRCVVFTDCPVVTDKGIEYLAQIPTLTSLGLRQMSITDAACDTIVQKMRLADINMPNCTNVTVHGLLKVAQAQTMESLGFSAGLLTQDDLIRLIQTAGPKMKRMDIELAPSAERRIDLSALRQAGEARKIKLFAVRNNDVKKL